MVSYWWNSPQREMMRVSFSSRPASLNSPRILEAVAAPPRFTVMVAEGTGSPCSLMIFPLIVMGLARLRKGHSMARTKNVLIFLSLVFDGNGAHGFRRCVEFRY